MYAQQHSRRRIRHGNLFQRQEVTLRIKIKSVEALRNEHAEESQLGHLRDHHAIKARRLITFPGQCDEFALRIGARQRLNFLLCGGQIEQ